MTIPAPAAELITRSNRIGEDPRNTNFGGGNTSAKGSAVDPASGKEVELVWVKGSGGDLRTLKASGLAVLRRDRVLALKEVYRGIEHEDEMVALFDYCIHGKPQAAPSIDTSMHTLVNAAHVDHLHPDSGIAIANSSNGEELTSKVYGDRVLWVPWRRPGFQLGLDIAEMKEKNPNAVGAILGGHGITAWGDTSEECEENSLWIIRAAEEYIAKNGSADPFGAEVPARVALEESVRRERAAALMPTIRGLAATDERVVGHFNDSAEVLDFVSRERAGELAARGTSCPDHYLRTKIVPLFLEIENETAIEDALKVLARAHTTYRD
jgi:rhamnose utilization protein RhaD (predicted bifunctional aldolase and dehydrogenase)